MNIFNETKIWAQSLGLKSHFVNQLDSTQTFAKQNLGIQLVMADQQSEGKGRFERTWTNPRSGTGMLATWALHFDRPVGLNFSAKTGWCLLTALQKAFPDLQFTVKPPNDIWIDNKKIAGILIENIVQNHCHTLIGVGINVMQTAAVAQAGCLQEHTQVNSEKWNQFLNEWWHQLSSLKPETELTENQCKDLFFAISKHSDFKNLTAVLPDASLQFNNKVMNWMDL
jgi:BirA family biotin operon repressor/biotin-[acetyl-CoA-carboxylase] ligase